MNNIVVRPPDVPDLLGASPADLVTAGGELPESTLDEARRRAERIRSGIPTYGQMRQDIADAYARRDWVALGYGSWSEYLDGEFGEELRRLSAIERPVAVVDMREQGMSVRQIGARLGVGKSTVHDALTGSGVRARTPERVTGADGKQYAAKKPRRAPSTEDSPAGREPAPDAPAEDPAPAAVELGAGSLGSGRPGPAPDDEVWVATSRRGIDAHRPDGVASSGAAVTACGRSTRTGQFVAAAQAVASWGSKWCPRCWPPATREERAQVRLDAVREAAPEYVVQIPAAEADPWWCQQCGHHWPVEPGASNECPTGCGGRGGFFPAAASPQSPSAPAGSPGAVSDEGWPATGGRARPAMKLPGHPTLRDVVVWARAHGWRHSTWYERADQRAHSWTDRDEEHVVWLCGGSLELNVGGEFRLQLLDPTLTEVLDVLAAVGVLPVEMSSAYRAGREAVAGDG